MRLFLCLFLDLRMLLTEGEYETEQITPITKSFSTCLYRLKKKNTHEAHSIAEHPSAFLVTSTASSNAIGSNVIELIPMIVITTKSPTKLWGLTIEQVTQYSHTIAQGALLPAQTKESHPTATQGTKILVARANLCVNTRSRSGAVIIAATIPVSSIQAPKNPLMSDE